MTSAENQLQKELKYLMALSVVRKLYAEGKLKKEVCKRLNRKNAETLECEEVPLLK